MGDGERKRTGAKLFRSKMIERGRLKLLTSSQLSKQGGSKGGATNSQKRK